MSRMGLCCALGWEPHQTENPKAQEPQSFLRSETLRYPAFELLKRAPILDSLLPRQQFLDAAHDSRKQIRIRVS